MKPSVLVAGMGDASSGDAGFGGAVVRRIGQTSPPKWVRAADYGTAGTHLALDLLEGYETTVLVDVLSRGAAPGTLCLRELGGACEREADDIAETTGTHADVVLDLLHLLGGKAGRVLALGCEPVGRADGHRLSEPVRRAVPEAVRTIQQLVEQEQSRVVQRALSLEV